MDIQSKVQRTLQVSVGLVQRIHAQRGIREIVYGLLLIVTVVSGYFLHSYWVEQREKRAFGALNDVIEAFGKAQQVTMGMHDEENAEKRNQAWEHVEVLLDALYQENSGSYLAPYFSLYKAQLVLAKGGIADEARKHVENALSSMSRGNALYSMIQLFCIKLSFDSADQSVKDKALKQLQDIAQSEKDYGFEEANYTLGVYYLSQGEQEKAEACWQAIVNKAEADAVVQSPWVKVAKERLQIIE